MTKRHKKWLIITIWISTIAFVGAGFVGWGQYSYGDKAGAVAKVGSVEITMGELQKAYSRLYAQYNKMFQGNFDEEKAKQFGLQKQALEQLIQQSLLVNLAESYDLQIDDKELISTLKTHDYFFKDGVFDKETYKQILSQNKMSTKEYESALKRELLIQKTLTLLPVQETEAESSISNTISSIADKINYKVLAQDQIKVDTSDKLVKAFWETRAGNYMSEVSYEVKYITQEQVKDSYTDDKISKHYNENRTHFKDKEGKILSLDLAKEFVTKELNEKATKDKALRTYISYKKGKLEKDVKFNSLTVSNSNNKFNPEVLDKISKLSTLSPYMKPILIDNIYYTFELVKVNPSKKKTYQEAKKEVTSLYVIQTKKEKLQELANSSLESFNGTTTDFITANDSEKLSALNEAEASEFLQNLFVSSKKRSYITLASGKVVLYYILEQKLLDNTNNNQENSILKLKKDIFSKALVKTLENKYQTEIFIQGL